MTQIKSHSFPEVYKGLGINLSSLGCVMLDVELNALKGLTFENAGIGDWYYAKDKTRFWIDGLVGETTAHLTLLYGLLETAKNYEWHIEQVLKGWEMDTIEVESIGFFESPYPDEPYYCIVAHIKVTPELMEGHQRLELLPHVNTFAGYKPHVTLAYVKKESEKRDRWIKDFEVMLLGKKLPLNKGINLGGNK